MLTNYLSLVTTTQNITKVSFLCSSILGIILIYLTIFKVRKIMGTYKHLMITFTCFGITLASLEAIFHPNLHFYNDGFVYFSLSTPFGWGNEILKVFLAIYTGVYSLTVSMLAVQFIYRYCVLFSLPHLTYFRNWKILIWFFYCLFFSSFWMTATYFLLQMDTTSKLYFYEEMLSRYSVTSEDVPMMTCLAFEPNTSYIRWRDVSYTFCITFMMGCQYSVMIYCGWNMHHRMEERLQHVSMSSRHVHRQLFRTLVLQITTPTVFLFAPLLVTIYVPYFQIKWSLPAGAAICAFSIYPALDSLIVFAVVTEYRIVAKSKRYGSERGVRCVLRNRLHWKVHYNETSIVLLFLCPIKSVMIDFNAMFAWGVVFSLIYILADVKYKRHRQT